RVETIPFKKTIAGFPVVLRFDHDNFFSWRYLLIFSFTKGIPVRNLHRLCFIFPFQKLYEQPLGKEKISQVFFFPFTDDVLHFRSKKIFNKNRLSPSGIGRSQRNSSEKQERSH